MTERAAAYVRQSVANREGIERATQRVHDLIDRRGWVLAGDYVDDGVSASKSRAKATRWAALLADIEAGNIDVVVGVDMDRLVRSQRDLLTLIDLKVKVVTVDGEIDLASADGEFRASMLAAIARFEVRRKAERQKRASEFRASKGQVFAGGRRAFGWMKDNMTADPREAAWVVWMHKQFLSGASLGSIARILNASPSGASTTMGGEFTSLQVKAILRRPRNAGVFIFRGEVQPVSNIEPLVSMDMHRAVLGRLGEGVRNPRNADAWLSGLLLCACGATMHSKNHFRKGKEPERYYVCGAGTKAIKRGTGSGGHASIPARLAEQGARAGLFRALYTGALQLQSKADAESIEDLQRQLADLADDRLAATDALMERGTDKARVRARLARIDQEVTDLARERDRLLAAGVGSTELQSMANVMLLARSVVAQMVGPDGLAVMDGWENQPFYKLDDSITTTGAEVTRMFESFTDDERRNVMRALVIRVKPGRGGVERVMVSVR